MGREAECSCNWAGKAASVKALIEPPDLILRGGLRKRVPLTQMADVHADGDVLRFTFTGEAVAITLGSALAAKWAKAVTAPPPSLAKKLGIDDKTCVHVIGKEDDNALEAALEVAGKRSKTTGDLIVARVNTQPDVMDALHSAAQELSRGVAIWFVYPKGRGQAITEHDVRGAALAAGLVDTKVAAVTDRLTALRCVKRRG